MFGGILFIQCIQMSNKQAKILNHQQSEKKTTRDDSMNKTKG